MKVVEYKSRKELMLALASALCLIFLVLYLLVLPRLHKYQDLNNIYETQLKKSENIEEQIKIKSSVVLTDATTPPPQLQEVESYFNNLYGSNLTVSELNEKTLKFKIDLLIDSPRAFYELISSLEDAPWQLQLAYPVEFVREDNSLKCSFNLVE